MIKPEELRKTAADLRSAAAEAVKAADESVKTAEKLEMQASAETTLVKFFADNLNRYRQDHRKYVWTEPVQPTTEAQRIIGWLKTFGHKIVREE